MKKNADSDERFVELKNRYYENGLESLSEQEQLELLLRFSDKRIDSASLAEKLLSEYGCLHTAFEMPFAALSDMGLNDKEAALLMMMPQLYERYRISIVEQKYRGKPLDTDEAVAEYMSPHFSCNREEIVVLLLLSKHRTPLLCDIINDGTVNASDINIRKILELCVSNNAEYAVIAHNHPSGIALPSEKDIDATLRLIEKTSLIGVTLLDHIIFADSERTFLSKLNNTKCLFIKKQ